MYVFVLYTYYGLSVFIVWPILVYLCLIYLTGHSDTHARAHAPTHNATLVKSSHRIECSQVYIANQVNISIICCFYFILSLLLFALRTTENGFIVKSVLRSLCVCMCIAFSLQLTMFILNCVLFVSNVISVVQMKSYFIVCALPSHYSYCHCRCAVWKRRSFE